MYRTKYAYDAAKRRVVQKTYDSGELDETRHFYYSRRWQVMEERLSSSGTISGDPDRQFVWGLRYIDDFVLRDRDTDSNGSLDEQLYALQDANWNVTALADTSGSIQERYAYSAYAAPRVLTPSFTSRASSNNEVDVLYAGYRYEQATGVFHIRHRVYHAELGCWAQRDPVMVDVNYYRYIHNRALVSVDPLGLASLDSGSAKAIVNCMIAKWPVGNAISSRSPKGTPADASSCTSNALELISDKGIVAGLGSIGVDLLFLGLGSQVKGILGNLGLASIQAVVEQLTSGNDLGVDTIIDVLMSTLDLPYEQAKVLAPVFSDMLEHVATGVGSCQFVSATGGRDDTSSGGESVMCQFLVCANTEKYGLLGWRTRVKDWKVTGRCKYTCVRKENLHYCCCETSATIDLKLASGSGTGANCKVNDSVQISSEGFPES